MIIPVFFVRDVPEEIVFLTRVLDFTLAFVTPGDAPFYAVLTRGPDELHLNRAHGNVQFGHCSAIVLCDDVDGLFAAFKARGFCPPLRGDSPVHEGPLDQSWGTREVYIDDPSGNTLVFQQRR